MAAVAGGGGGSGGDTRSAEQKNRDAFRKTQKSVTSGQVTTSSKGVKSTKGGKSTKGDGKYTPSLKPLERTPTIFDLWTTRAQSFMAPFIEAAGGKKVKNRGLVSPTSLIYAPSEDVVAREVERQGPDSDDAQSYIVVPEDDGTLRTITSAEQQANSEKFVQQAWKLGWVKETQQDVSRGMVRYGIEFTLDERVLGMAAELAAVGVFETRPAQIPNRYKEVFDRIDRYNRRAAEERLADPLSQTEQYRRTMVSGQMAVRDGAFAKKMFQQRTEALKGEPNVVSRVLNTMWHRVQFTASYLLFSDDSLIENTFSRPVHAIAATYYELGQRRDARIEQFRTGKAAEPGAFEAAQLWDKTMPEDITNPDPTRGRIIKSPTVYSVSRAIAKYALGFLHETDPDEVDALYRYMMVTNLNAGEFEFVDAARKAEQYDRVQFSMTGYDPRTRDNVKQPSFMTQVSWFANRWVFDALNVTDFTEVSDVEKFMRRKASVKRAADAAEASRIAARTAELRYASSGYTDLSQAIAVQSARVIEGLRTTRHDWNSVQLTQGTIAATAALATGRIADAAELARNGRSVVEVLDDWGMRFNHLFSKPIPDSANAFESRMKSIRYKGSRIVEQSLARSKSFKRVAASLHDLRGATPEQWYDIATHIFGSEATRRIGYRGARLLTRDELLSRVGDLAPAVSRFLDEWTVLSRALADDMSRNSEALLNRAYDVYRRGGFGDLSTPEGAKAAEMAFREWVGGFSNAFEMVEATTKGGKPYKRLIDLGDIRPKSESWDDGYLPLFHADEMRGPSVVDLSRSAVYPWMKRAKGMSAKMFMEQFGNAGAITKSIALRVRGNAQWQARAMMAEYYLDLLADGQAGKLRPEFLSALERVSAGTAQMSAKAARFTEMFLGLNDGSPERAQLVQDLWLAVRDPSLSVAEREDIVATVRAATQAMRGELDSAVRVAEDQISVLRYAAGLYAQGDEALYSRAVDAGLVDYSGAPRAAEYANEVYGTKAVPVDNPEWLEWREMYDDAIRQFEQFEAKGDHTAVSTGYGRSSRAPRNYADGLVERRRQLDEVEALEPARYVEGTVDKTRASETFRIPDPRPRRAAAVRSAEAARHRDSVVLDGLRAELARYQHEQRRIEARIAALEGEVSDSHKELASAMESVKGKKTLSRLYDDLSQVTAYVHDLESSRIPEREEILRKADARLKKAEERVARPVSKHAGRTLGEIAADGDLDYVRWVAYRWGKKAVDVIDPKLDGGLKKVWVDASRDPDEVTAAAKVREQAWKVYHGFKGNVPPVRTRVMFERDLAVLAQRGYDAAVWGSRRWFDRYGKEYGFWGDDELEYVMRVVRDEAADRLHRRGLSRAMDPALFDSEVEALVPRILAEPEFRTAEVALDPSYVVASGKDLPHDRSFIPADRMFVWDEAKGAWRGLVPDAPEADPEALLDLALRGSEDLRAPVVEAGRLVTEPGAALQARVGLELVERLGVHGYNLGDRARELLSGLARGTERLELAAKHVEAFLDATTVTGFADDADGLAKMFDEVDFDGLSSVDRMRAVVAGAEFQRSKLLDEVASLNETAAELSSLLDGVSPDADGYGDLVGQVSRIRSDVARKSAVAWLQDDHIKRLRSLDPESGLFGAYALSAKLLRNGEITPESMRAISPADLEEAFGRSLTFLSDDPAQSELLPDVLNALVMELRRSGETPLDIAFALYGGAIAGETRTLLDALWDMKWQVDPKQIRFVDDGRFRQATIAGVSYAFDPELMMDGLQAAYARGTFRPVGGDISSALSARADRWRQQGRAYHARAFAVEATFDDVFENAFGVRMADFYEQQDKSVSAFSDMLDVRAQQEANKVRIAALRAMQEQAAYAMDHLDRFDEAVEKIVLDDPVFWWRGKPGELALKAKPLIEAYDTVMQLYRGSVLVSGAFVIGNAIDIGLKNMIGGVPPSEVIAAFKHYGKAVWAEGWDKGSELVSRMRDGITRGANIRPSQHVLTHEFVSDRVVRELADGDLMLSPSGRVPHIASTAAFSSQMGTALQDGKGAFLGAALEAFFDPFADKLELFGRQSIFKNAWDKAYGALLKERFPHLGDAIDGMMALPTSQRHAYLSEYDAFRKVVEPVIEEVEDEAFRIAEQKMLFTHFDYENLSRAEHLLKRFFMFPTFAINNSKFWGKTMLAHPAWLARYARWIRNENLYLVPLGDTGYSIDTRYFLSFNKVGRENIVSKRTDYHMLDGLNDALSNVGLDFVPVLSKMLQYHGAIETQNHRDGVGVLNLLARGAGHFPLVRKTFGTPGPDIPRLADHLMTLIFNETMGRIGAEKHESSYQYMTSQMWLETIRQAARNGWDENGEFDFVKAEQQVADRELLVDAAGLLLRAYIKPDKHSGVPGASGRTDEDVASRDLFYSTFDIKPTVYVPDSAIAYGAGRNLAALKQSALDRIPGWDTERRSAVKESYAAQRASLEQQFPTVFTPRPQTAAEERALIRKERLSRGVAWYVTLAKRKEAELAAGPQAGPGRKAIKDKWKRKIDAYLSVRPDVAGFIGRDLPGREATWAEYDEGVLQGLIDQYMAQSYKTDPDGSKRDAIERQSRALAEQFRKAQQRRGYDVLTGEFPSVEQYLWAKATPLERRVQQWYERPYTTYEDYYKAFQRLPRDVREVVLAWRGGRGFATPGSWRSTPFGRSYPALAGSLSRRTGSFEEWWNSYLSLTPEQQAAVNAKRRRYGKPPFPVGDAAKNIDWGVWAEQHGIKRKPGTGMFHGVPSSVVDGYFNIPKEMKHARREYLLLHPELQVAFDTARLVDAQRIEQEREEVLASMPDLAARVQEWTAIEESHVPPAQVPKVAVEYESTRDEKRKRDATRRNRGAN